MRKFVSLSTDELPASYDAESQGASPVVEVTESKDQISIVYRFSGYFSVERELKVKGHQKQFEALDIAGVGYLMDSGKPELPSFGRYVQIPAGAKYTVKVTTPGRPVEFENVTVAPAQVKITDAPTKPKLEYDEAAYGSDDLYPSDVVSVSGPMLVDSYYALLVHVCPFQYRAKSRLLIAHPRIDVVIELNAGDAADSGGATGGATGGAESREAFGNLFLNPRRGVADRVSRALIAPIVLPHGPELLIVYVKPLAVAARQLAKWKNRRGLITELLEFEGDISTPDKAKAACEALKDTLRARRGARGARLNYVILLGDIDDIPNEERGGNTTDFYYSTPANYNAAQPLQMAWLSLGRIPVRDANEAKLVVDQIISYERTPPADPSYYHRFVAAAHFETSLDGAGRAVDGRNYAFTMETIRAFLVAQGWDAERVYTCDRTITTEHPLFYRNGTPVPADVVADLMTPAAATQCLVAATTEGHLMIGHRDHGDQGGWYMPPFGMTDLDNVTGTMPSIFYSINCLTGSFQATTTTECFAEKVLRMPGTAPTLIAATELSNTWHNNAMMMGLFDAIYGGLLPTFPGTTVSYPVQFNRFGDILNYSRAYLATAFNTQPGGVLNNYEMYHVMGDPSLEVWADEPRRLRMTAKPYPLLKPTSLLVELSEAAANCVVTVWLGERLLKRLTPSGRRFTIQLGTLPPAPPLVRPPSLTLCAWAPGYRFAELQVRLPVQPHLEPVPSGSTS